MLQAHGKTLASIPNVIPVSLPCSSFSGIPQGSAEALRSLRRGRTRTRGGVRRLQTAQAAPRSDGARAPKTRTTVQFAGTVGFSAAEATSKTHVADHVLPFAVPLAGKPGLEFSHEAHSALLCQLDFHCLDLDIRIDMTRTIDIKAIDFRCGAGGLTRGLLDAGGDGGAGQRRAPTQDIRAQQQARPLRRRRHRRSGD